MKELLLKATSGDLPADRLSRDIQDGQSRDLDYRRAIVAVSLVGIAAMGFVSLFQTGVIRHLPDPQTRRPHFHSDKVNSSKEAYSYGMPDAPIAVTSHGFNMMLAAAGPQDRARRRPWLPISAALVAGAQSVVAATYLFYQMPKVDKAWCPYCVVDALAMLGTLALTLPEAARATSRLQRRF